MSSVALCSNNDGDNDFQNHPNNLSTSELNTRIRLLHSRVMTDKIRFAKVSDTHSYTHVGQLCVCVRNADV